MQHVLLANVAACRDGSKREALRTWAWAQIVGAWVFMRHACAVPKLQKVVSFLALGSFGDLEMS